MTGALLHYSVIFVLLVGALIGYFRGLYGDGGSFDRAIDWAVKTDLLLILLFVLSVVLGKIQAYLESEWQLQLPFIASIAVPVGFMLAIMNGASVLLGMNSGELGTSILSGFIQGVLGGGLGAVLIQITDKKKVSETHTIEKQE